MKVIIAGGGTGGHLFPGIAVAEKIVASTENDVLFVGTKNGIEARVLPQDGWPHQFITISGIKTRGLFGKCRAVLQLPRALFQSIKIIRQYKPDAVLGVGGYASGPLVLMASLLRYPTAIIEQNSVPGLANKILGRFVDSVFLAFDETAKYFASKKIQMTGNPIRGSICKLLEEPVTGASGIVDTTGSQKKIFVFGGSQGAQAINRLVVAAAMVLQQNGLRVDIVHQTGKGDLEATVLGYQQAGVEAQCFEFIRDMAKYYQWSDVVISRSGATTVAELAIVGKPSIFIPFPYAADDHQTVNAQELVEKGAAKMLLQKSATPAVLAQTIQQVLSPQEWAKMSDSMRELGRPHAAETIMKWCQSQVDTA